MVNLDFWNIESRRNWINMVDFLRLRDLKLMVLCRFLINIHISAELIQVSHWPLKSSTQLGIADIRRVQLIHCGYVASNQVAILPHSLYILYCLLSKPWHGRVWLLRRTIEEICELLLHSLTFLSDSVRNEGIVV